MEEMRDEYDFTEAVPRGGRLSAFGLLPSGSWKMALVPHGSVHECRTPCADTRRM
jgi:hypothetical protein